MRWNGVNAALAVIAVVALAGCGSSRIQGSGTFDGAAPSVAGSSAAPSGSGSASTAPTASASTPPTGTPTGSVDLSLPADVKIVFPPLSDGRPDAQKLLQDWRDGQLAYYAAAAKADPGHPAIRRYYLGSALLAVESRLQAKQQSGRTIIGTLRYTTVRVVSVSAAAAAVVSCYDATQYFARDVRTNRPVIYHGPSDHVRTTTTLVRDSSTGVWMSITSDDDEGVSC